MRILRKILVRLPQSLRAKIVRRLVQLPTKMISDLEFKVADTQEELESAFKLLHDSYVEQNYMQATSSGLRVTKYHALPSSVVLIGKHRGQVISTLTVIRDSALGLPLDAAFDLSQIRRHCVHLAEISSLAIHKDYRRDHGMFLWPLLKFFHRYTSDYMGVDGVVMGSHPSFRDLYQSILLFDVIKAVKVEEQLDKYSFANGNPVVGFFETFKSLKLKYEKIYSAKCDTRNLLKYFFSQADKDYFIWPNRADYRNLDFKMSPQLVSYFFTHQSDCFQSMSAEEAKIILSHYSSKEYKWAVRVLSEKQNRFQPSLFTRLPLNTAALVKSGGQSSFLQVINVSETGVKLKGDLPSTRFSVLLRVGSGKSIDLNLSWVRSCPDQDQCHGLIIENPSQEWVAFIRSMQRTLERAA